MTRVNATVIDNQECKHMSPQIVWMRGEDAEITDVSVAFGSF